MTEMVGDLDMTEIAERSSAVTPDGFHLEPTYEEMVAETGYDPELGEIADDPA